MGKIERIPATPEQSAKQMGNLRTAFPNKDAFFELLMEYIIPLKITETELKSAIKNIIGGHKGQLFVADIVEECRRQKLLTIRRQETRELEMLKAKWRAEWTAEQETNKSFQTDVSVSNLNESPPSNIISRNEK
jgi:hypothetical protein